MCSALVGYYSMGVHDDDTLRVRNLRTPIIDVRTKTVARPGGREGDVSNTARHTRTLPVVYVAAPPVPVVPVRTGVFVIVPTGTRIYYVLYLTLYLPMGVFSLKIRESSSKNTNT